MSIPTCTCILNELNLTSYLFTSCFINFDRLEMLIIPSSKMSKSPHLSIQSYSLSHLRLISPSHLGNILVWVTQPYTSLFTMILVITHTQPTKLISTLRTSHVHTSTVLLNVSLAFRTRLSVYPFPQLSWVRSAFILLYLLNEKSSVVAIQWHMSFILTFEAKSMATVTMHIHCNLVRLVNT